MALRGMLAAGCALLALIVPAQAGAKMPDNADWMFEAWTVAGIDFDLPQSSIDAINDDPSEYAPATMTASIQGAAYPPVAVGLRLRGSSSFRPLSGKASFKVKLPKTPLFLGLKKLTLGNMVQDPSMMHETLSYDLFRAADVAAPRAGYAYVTINGQDYGLYANIETLDEIGIARWYPTTQHLYEGQYAVDARPADVPYFEPDVGDGGDLADLEALAAAVTSTDGSFSSRVAGLADLDQMTRMWAVEKYVGHWDGYASGAPNNYYLHSTDAGLFTMLPWGTDQTLDERTPFDEAGGLMFQLCLADPPCLAMYRARLAELPGLVSSLDLIGRSHDLQAMLAPYQAQDPRLEYTLDDIARADDVVRTFLSSREGDLYDADMWPASTPLARPGGPVDPPPPPPPPAEPDNAAPQTTITRAPNRRANSKRSTARFAFTSTEAGSTFACRVDDRDWKACESPLRLSVGGGDHVFRVRATDAAGNPDPSPARRRWSIGRG